MTFLFLLAIGCSACSGIHLQGVTPAPKTVEIKVDKYCPADGNAFQNVFAFNFSAIRVSEGYITDTDRDGLSDQFEAEPSIKTDYNINLNTADTNGDSYSDLFVYSIGEKVDQQVALRACDSGDQDTDRDGLTDCEENFLRTDHLNPDTDADGIPDGIEFRYDLNPTDPNDAGIDTDNDGLSNLSEIKMNTLTNTAKSFQKLNSSFEYSVQTTLDPQTQSNCYQVSVKNIPIVDVNNGNQIKLMFLETKNVIGQGQITEVRDVTLIVSKAVLQNQIIEVPDVQNQTLTITMTSGGQ